MYKELEQSRFYEAFQFNKVNKSWYCYICSNPDKAEGTTKAPLIIFIN